MSASSVVCASCGKQIPLDVADVVDFGTGYRCEACTVRSEVDAHIRQAEANERAQREASYKIGYYAYGPSAKQVKAEVDAIRQHVTTADEARVPTPAEAEPIIQDDEDTLINSMVTTKKPSHVEPCSASASEQIPEPRYVCIVCFAVARDAPGQCPRDGVPLSDLVDPEVVTELREHVRRRANRREARRFAATISLSIVFTIVMCLAMGWSLDRHGPGPWLMSASGAVGYMLSRLVVRPVRARNHANELLTAIGLRERR